jgi:hypothetical protein
MNERHYCVVGIRSGGGSSARHENLSLETAELIKAIMLQSRLYRKVVIQNQPDDERKQS